MSNAENPPLQIYRRLWAYTRKYIWMFALGIIGVSIDAAMQADSNMPAYKDMLTDEEITAVLEFIKSQWPDDIKAARSQ